MDYKLSNDILKLREYGRNVQMMVEEIKKIEDKEKRSAAARDIQRIMGTLAPQSKEGDWRHKLWDQLCHIADYQIDVDSEFEIPDPKEMYTRPTKRMPYTKSTSRFRQYGHNVQLMVKEAAEATDPDKVKGILSLAANTMRMQLGTPEKDPNLELMILEHLKDMCKGKLTFDPADIQFYRNFILRVAPRNVSLTAGIQKRSSNANKKKKKK